MKMSEVRQKSEAEIKALIKEVMKQTSELERNISLGKEKNTSLLKKKSQDLAQLKTVITEMSIVKKI